MANTGTYLDSWRITCDKSCCRLGKSLDGYVASDREHPGVAVPEVAELIRWKVDHLVKAGAHPGQERGDGT